VSYRSDCEACNSGAHPSDSSGGTCWCCGWDDSPKQEKTLAQKGWELSQRYADEAKEAKEMEDKIWLRGDNFNFKVDAWKGDWEDDVEPTELEIVHAMGYRVHEWDDDECGGPGICLYVTYKNISGKIYTTQFIIPKDELIKALALLVG
jgi:hypothetical protein